MGWADLAPLGKKTQAIGARAELAWSKANGPDTSEEGSTGEQNWCIVGTTRGLRCGCAYMAGIGMVPHGRSQSVMGEHVGSRGEE